jgi:hypothetical protein
MPSTVRPVAAMNGLSRTVVERLLMGDQPPIVVSNPIAPTGLGLAGWRLLTICLFLRHRYQIDVPVPPVRVSRISQNPSVSDN